MFVNNAQFLELFGEFCLEHLLEQVLEPTIIIFQDRILGGQIDRPFAGHAIIQRRPRKVADRIVEIVHRQCNAG